MSLSELLSFYINKKKTNITQFAQYLEIDRSTLHKIIKGQRPATSEALVNKMAQYLCLSQEETKQILEAYEIVVNISRISLRKQIMYWIIIITLQNRYKMIRLL